MGIVDDLLAHPGLYVGIDTVTNSDVRGAARVVVTPLPGRAGVTLDYDIFNPAFPDNPRGHAEHTVIARTHEGGVVMVVADTHSRSVAILHEGDPGVFEPRDGDAPYPQKVVLSMPEPGRIRHAWWYGSPGEQAVERDVSDLTLTS
jgi:hypothetical protein